MPRRLRFFGQALVEAIDGEATTLLELGAGAGHNAVHLKGTFVCTLSDLSESMLALSRELNPTCDHVLGDMRTLRLGRSFDAVLVHDAICHMATESDLRPPTQLFVRLRRSVQLQRPVQLRSALQLRNDVPAFFAEAA